MDPPQTGECLALIIFIINIFAPGEFAYIELVAHCVIFDQLHLVYCDSWRIPDTLCIRFGYSS